MLVKRPRRHHFVRNIILLSIFAVFLIGGIYIFANLYLDNQSSNNTDKSKTDRENLVASVLAAKEAKRKEPVYISLPGAKTVRAIVEDYNLPNSIWKLVNKSNSLPVDYIPKPISIPTVSTRTDKSNDERSARNDIHKALADMFSAAEKDGLSLMIGSGYRSASLQKIYFDSLAASVGNAAANQAIAYPGQSEHQSALAVDITGTSLECYLSECFDSIDDGVWLTNNSYKYGFILRYPKGKENITGYQYEPWHFRYVGVDLATALFESKLTLEEAWPFIESALKTLKENGAI